MWRFDDLDKTWGVYTTPYYNPYRRFRLHSLLAPREPAGRMLPVWFNSRSTALSKLLRAKGQIRAGPSKKTVSSAASMVEFYCNVFRLRQGCLSCLYRLQAGFRTIRGGRCSGLTWLILCFTQLLWLGYTHILCSTSSRGCWGWNHFFSHFLIISHSFSNASAFISERKTAFLTR